MCAYTHVSVVARVHTTTHTVKQLVDEYEVVLDVFLRDVAKIGLQHLHHLVKELEHHGSIHVGLWWEAVKASQWNMNMCK